MLAGTCGQTRARALSGESAVPGELIRRTGPTSRTRSCPNGVSLQEVGYVPPALRREYKQRLGMSARYLALFIASWHEPNVIAAEALVDLASQVTSVQLLIVGSVGLALQRPRLPDNAELMGTLSSEFKQAVLGAADVARILSPPAPDDIKTLRLLCRRRTRDIDAVRRARAPAPAGLALPGRRARRLRRHLAAAPHCTADPPRRHGAVRSHTRGAALVVVSDRPGSARHPARLRSGSARSLPATVAERAGS